MQNARPGGVQAIARAGSVLRALEAAPGGLGLSELAAEAGLAKSTAHRLVGALADEGLVVAGSEIRLGPEIMRLAEAAREALPDLLRPVLSRLQHEFGETVDLAVLDGSSVRFVDQIAAPHRLRAVSAVGARFPLAVTANGKALLAALPADQVAALVDADVALRGELRRIRADGVAFDREEHSEGICAVGAAVSDRSGPVAAISVPVPSHRFADRERELADGVRAAADEASRLLGAA